MKKEDKSVIIENIKEVVSQYPHFYLTETSGMNAAQVSELRRACFKADIKMLVVKNKLMIKALDQLEADYSPLYTALKENTAVLFSNVGNAPARLIKDFNGKNMKPTLKGAYVEESIYGADQLETLCSIKSKNELIADVIALLQSPAKNVVSALQSGGNTIHGVLKTLAERQ
ncbi:MAG: 50S ribosomal protein L10 [Paludibacteraceae bacterium]|nr:50S ribosomal protein L10 [Candidatus Colousia faecequi]MCQ2337527.1 50S ribosomal protein L10 [Paludibacteraceae bacterium]